MNNEVQSYSYPTKCIYIMATAIGTEVVVLRHDKIIEIRINTSLDNTDSTCLTTYEKSGTHPSTALVIYKQLSRKRMM